MKTIEHSVRLARPAEDVWRVMLDARTYNGWARGFSPGSVYRGEWREGEEIEFLDPEIGGTRARIDELTPHRRIHVTHVGLIDRDGGVDTTSETARKWIGVTETYDFAEDEGGTRLTVTMNADEAFEEMLSTGWTKSLEHLKEMTDG